MIWLIFRFLIMALVTSAPHDRTHHGELVILVAYLMFDLFWLGQRRQRALHTVGSLLFSLMLGSSFMLLLLGGSLVSVAFLWPSMMLRLEDRSLEERRLALVAAQLMLLVLVPESEFPLLCLRFVPILLTLIQLRGGRPALGANSGAIAWLIGPLVQAWFFPGELSSPALARNAVLILLPQLGLRALHKRG